MLKRSWLYFRTWRSRSMVADNSWDNRVDYGPGLMGMIESKRPNASDNRKDVEIFTNVGNMNWIFEMVRRETLYVPRVAPRIWGCALNFEHATRCDYELPFNCGLQ